MGRAARGACRVGRPLHRAGRRRRGDGTGNQHRLGDPDLAVAGWRRPRRRGARPQGHERRRRLRARPRRKPRAQRRPRRTDGAARGERHRPGGTPAQARRPFGGRPPRARRAARRLRAAGREKRRAATARRRHDRAADGAVPLPRARLSLRPEHAVRAAGDRHPRARAGARNAGGDRPRDGRRGLAARGAVRAERAAANRGRCAAARGRCSYVRCRSGSPDPRGARGRWRRRARRGGVCALRQRQRADHLARTGARRRRSGGGVLPVRREQSCPCPARAGPHRQRRARRCACDRP